MPVSFARVSSVIVFGVIGLYVAAQLPARAQDDKDKDDAVAKKKTQELLDKAAEEYRVFFKKPETAIEVWAASKCEMDLGKFDLAGLHLKLLLEKEPKKDIDKDLVKLERAEGMSAVLRLQRGRPELWSDHKPFREEAVKNVDELIKRVTAAVRDHLSDPDRIKKYISRLDALTDEERRYAANQIADSQEYAVPFLIEAMRTNYGKPLYTRVREMMTLIGRETVPRYVEVLKAANDKDYRDEELRLTLLDIIKKRDDSRDLVVPYLWHMSASKKYPPAVRAKAKETLASLLRIPITEVPPARESLVYLAERYYQIGRAS